MNNEHTRTLRENHDFLEINKKLTQNYHLTVSIIRYEHFLRVGNNYLFICQKSLSFYFTLMYTVRMRVRILGSKENTVNHLPTYLSAFLMARLEDLYNFILAPKYWGN